MSKSTRKILEKIIELEAEKSRLLPLRKEEIFNVLETSGGLTLDNRLLAGLAIYVSDPKNKESNFLKELKELGKKKIPSSRNRSSVKKSNSVHSIQQTANT